MDIREELKSAGVYPSGPVSAWPESRNDDLLRRAGRGEAVHATKVKTSVVKMATGLFKAAGQGIVNGRVSEEVRNERYDTCKACPAFVEGSKRCSECGCFMEAKTWIGGNPDTLCPLKKWER